MKQRMRQGEPQEAVSKVNPGSLSLSFTVPFSPLLFPDLQGSSWVSSFP